MMSTPVDEAAELIDVISGRGYEPCEDAPEFVRADLIFSGIGIVRITVDDEVTVYVFDKFMALRWDARLGNAPLPAIVAVLDAAEADARRPRR